MAKKFPIVPSHPERLCWGCDRYCARDSLMCGNGAERTQHPVELFGDDWMAFGLDAEPAPATRSDTPSNPPTPGKTPA